jgi:nicotinamide-nucleotide amidase
MGVRAGIVVTGTEVLTGRVSDRNGPWLAEQLRQLGVDVGQIVVVGDRRDDLQTALTFLGAGNDLVITSGGLGPTADDLTAEVVAQAQGRPATLDRELEGRITAIVERLSARLGGVRDPEATAMATRKQAMVPQGATVLEPAGTAPGLVVPVAEGRIGPPVIVLPGPPWELRQMWPAAVDAPAVQALLAGAAELRQRTLRLWGVPESELAATLRRLDAELGGLEITTCLRDGELEIVSRYSPDAEPAQQRLALAVRADFPVQLFSADGASVDELVATGLRDRNWTAAVVEAATGGAVSARLTRGWNGTVDSAAEVLGGLVVTSDPVTTALAAVPAELIAANGAVSPEVARAMAQGARTAFGTDVGIAVTGIEVAEVAAQPAGAADRTAARKVSSVHLSVVTPAGEHARSLATPGTPEIIRQRIVPALMHLLRQALTDPPQPAPGE